MISMAGLESIVSAVSHELHLCIHRVAQARDMIALRGCDVQDGILATTPMPHHFCSPKPTFQLPLLLSRHHGEVFSTGR